MTWITAGLISRRRGPPSSSLLFICLAIVPPFVKGIPVENCEVRSKCMIFSVSDSDARNIPHANVRQRTKEERPGRRKEICHRSHREIFDLPLCALWQISFRLPLCGVTTVYKLPSPISLQISQRRVGDSHAPTPIDRSRMFVTCRRVASRRTSRDNSGRVRALHRRGRSSFSFLPESELRQASRCT